MQRDTRVHKIPLILLLDVHPVVIRAVNHVVDVAILKFRRDAESLVPVAKTAEHLGLQLLTSAVIPLIITRIILHAVGLRPNNLTVMQTVVVVVIQAGHPTQSLVGMVLKYLCTSVLSTQSIEIVVHPLLGDEIRLLDGVIQRLKTVIGDFLVVLILFVVSVTACQIRHYLKGVTLQTVTADPNLRILQLIINLGVMVLGIFVVVAHPVDIVVLAAGVVGAVGGKAVIRDTVPSQTGSLPAEEQVEFQCTVILVFLEIQKSILCRQEAGVELYARIVDVAIAADVGEGSQHGEAFADEAGTRIHHVVEGVEGTVRTSHLGVCLVRDLLGNEVDTGAEERAAIVGVGAVLHSHLTDEGTHVGQVH